MGFAGDRCHDHGGSWEIKSGWLERLLVKYDAHTQNMFDHIRIADGAEKRKIDS